MVRSALVARVLIDSPLPQLDHLFDYAVPEELRADAARGVRVRVPLRTAGRIADGLIVELVDAAEHQGALSELEAVVSSVPVLTPEVWELARRVADRAAGGANDVLRLAIPPRQVRVEKQYLAALAADAAEAASEAAASGEETGAAGAGAADASAAGAGAAGDSGADAAADAGAPASVTSPPVAPPSVTGYGDDDLAAAVAAGERLAIAAIPRQVSLPGAGTDDPAVAVGEWAVTLAQLAGAALAQGRDAILAVPDYRDQEQLEAALAATLPGAEVVRLDARQANPARYRAFLACLGGHLDGPLEGGPDGRAGGSAARRRSGPRVIVGNRSVLYAPSARLGLIALFDDGDALHAEPLSPYVHARDVALVRQQLSGAALVFLGHTRTVEVERLVEIGFVRSVDPRPTVRPNVVPTASQFGADEQGAAARIPSTAWKAAREGLDEGPVLVQVARPGYAPAVACAKCRTVARCTRCQGPLAVRSAGARPSCGWCGLIAVDWSCRVCQATALRLITLGAGRTAEELGRAFPGTRVVVSDGSKTLLEVDARPALIVATRGAEPRVAGGYRAVLLLDGERMLARESLRVAEDVVRTWSNAAALAAPGAPVMLVGVGGRLATTLATWRQDEFARAELADRRALRFPPAVRLASVSGSADAVSIALEGLDNHVAGEHPAHPAHPAHDVLGPVGQDDGTVRAIVRFDYAHGAEIAERLRAAVVTNAAKRRKPPAGKGDYRPRPTLRLRFDDPEIL